MHSILFRRRRCCLVEGICKSWMALWRSPCCQLLRSRFRCSCHGSGRRRSSCRGKLALFVWIALGLGNAGMQRAVGGRRVLVDIQSVHILFELSLLAGSMGLSAWGHALRTRALCTTTGRCSARSDFVCALVHDRCCSSCRRCFRWRPGPPWRLLVCALLGGRRPLLRGGILRRSLGGSRTHVVQGTRAGNSSGGISRFDAAGTGGKIDWRLWRRWAAPLRAGCGCRSGRAQPVHARGVGNVQSASLRGWRFWGGRAWGRPVLLVVIWIWVYSARARAGIARVILGRRPLHWFLKEGPVVLVRCLWTRRVGQWLGSLVVTMCGIRRVAVPGRCRPVRVGCAKLGPGTARCGSSGRSRGCSLPPVRRSAGPAASAALRLGWRRVHSTGAPGAHAVVWIRRRRIGMYTGHAAGPRGFWRRGAALVDAQRAYGGRMGLVRGLGEEQLLVRPAVAPAFHGCGWHFPSSFRRPNANVAGLEVCREYCRRGSRSRGGCGEDDQPGGARDGGLEKLESTAAGSQRDCETDTKSRIRRRGGQTSPGRLCGRFK